MDLIDHASAARLLLPIVDDLLNGAALRLRSSAFLDKDVERDGIPLSHLVGSDPGSSILSQSGKVPSRRTPEEAAVFSAELRSA